MSSQTHKQLPQPPTFSSFATAATQTLAHITQLKQQTKSLQSLCLNTQNEAEKIRKNKLKLFERKAFFEVQAAETQLNDTLSSTYQKSLKQCIELEGELSEMQVKVSFQPQISIPQMGWVIQVLKEITQGNFAAFQQKIAQQKSLVESLEVMNAKYCQKLKKVEEKLAKGYAEAKSKKRYL